MSPLSTQTLEILRGAGFEVSHRESDWVCRHRDKHITSFVPDDLRTAEQVRKVLIQTHIIFPRDLH